MKQSLLGMEVHAQEKQSGAVYAGTIIGETRESVVVQGRKEWRLLKAAIELSVSGRSITPEQTRGTAEERIKQRR